MLVFRMDTTGFFRNGQRHELRILLPSSREARARLGRTSKNQPAPPPTRPVGRSNSHYIRSTEGISSRPNVFSTPVLSSAINANSLSQSSHLSRDKCLNNVYVPSGIDVSPGLSNGYPSSSGHPVPPVRRRRKNSSASTVKSWRRYGTVGQGNGSLSLSPTSGSSSPLTCPDESTQGRTQIRLRPDAAGKFGFNVKGGSDSGQPVIVSRVIPGSPADRCYPRLNEGDQVLLINGSDVAAMTHGDVVSSIRNAATTVSAVLVLTVKQNVYEAEYLDEPAFQYVPEILAKGTLSSGALSRVSPSSYRPYSTDAGLNTAVPLEESMLLLSEALESGSLVAQFEQLYRRKPGLTVDVAKRPENEKKNRYRDISPYDVTRVILKTSSSGDYINASHVVIETPVSGRVRRYIACQGPLHGTAADFWQMVWEQQATNVIMLTTVVEQGRVKCHCYWPRPHETLSFGSSLSVTCESETETDAFAFRMFTLTYSPQGDTPISRSIRHMQNLAWPDHGVPSDCTDFLHFVRCTREASASNELSPPPTIVHCSAGIGRTGVLILMEAAMSLIEAGQPVYPLDIVRYMRNQRAMMVQTAAQYRFVCDAIFKVYRDKTVQPLQQYVSPDN